MEATFKDDTVVLGGNARQQFHDARGYGRPLAGNEIACTPVEIAHLLGSGSLDSVAGKDIVDVVRWGHEHVDGFLRRYLVYTDIRERGFYLSPDRPGWVDSPTPTADFVVYPRGHGPGDGSIAFRLSVVDESDQIDLATERSLAVVDEEGDITYLSIETPDFESGPVPTFSHSFEGTQFGDRIVCWDPPSALYSRWFFGGELPTARPAVGLSLLEAAYLSEHGPLEVEDTDLQSVITNDRRYHVYRHLRNQGLTPKTGLKFGTDFRLYGPIDGVDSLGHSPWLIRVRPRDRSVDVRSLSLDVRLAHGVRKRMVFALTDAKKGTAPTWRSVGRFTP